MRQSIFRKLANAGWAVVETLVLIAVDLVLFNSPTVSVSDTKAEKLAGMRRRRRERAIERWVRKGDRNAPIPRVGILCHRCSYDLAGLTCDACPECGNEIEMRLRIRRSQT
jgi:hypothetical protein